VGLGVGVRAGSEVGVGPSVGAGLGLGVGSGVRVASSPQATARRTNRAKDVPSGKNLTNLVWAIMLPRLLRAHTMYTSDHSE
jgi:hypothetical protein